MSHRNHGIIKAMKNATKNFHVPLPEALYSELREQAERSGQAATAAAREAIAEWLAQRRRMELHEEIAAYAAKARGTAEDLDRALEREAARQLRKDSR
jgi:hypothetical protein